VIIGNVHRDKKKLIEKVRKSTLRHRIHQWSVAKLVEVLSNKPLCVTEVSEAYSSSIDSFTGKRIHRYIPSINSIAVRYLSSDGSLVALGWTEPHEVGVKLMNTYQGLTSLMELKAWEN